MAGFGDRTETNILERSIEKQRWNGLGYSPTQAGSFTKVIFFQLRGSASEVSNTGMLFCRRLFIIVKYLPSGVKPASWPTHLRSSNSISQVSGLLHTFLTGRLPGEPSGLCRQHTGSQVVRSTITAAEHMRMIRAE